MNNKKVAAVLLSSVMALSLMACGNSAVSDAQESSSSTSGEVTETTDTAEATDTAEETETTEATETIAASQTDDYKNIDMSKYSVEGMSIGVSFGQNVHPFFKAMQAGIEQACKDYGIDKISIQAADSTLEKQVTQIENLTSSGITSLLVNPYDSEGVATAVQGAIDAGVSVFSMDISVDGANPTYHIASDNKKIGELIGQRVDELLGGKGKVAIIGDPSVSSLKLRQEGFEEYIANTDIEIVANQIGANQRETSLSAAETILQANPDIDAFIGTNENSAMGIVGAINSAGLADKGIIVTGVDSTEDVMSGIENGTISFGVAQNPYQMGYMSVQNAIKVFNGEEVETPVELDCEYMTVDNVSTYIDREAAYNTEN